MKLRVWAEYISLEKVLEERTISLLQKYDVNLCIATPYGSLNEEWANFLKVYEDKGIEVALWLLLPDDLGYWPSERNADEFSKYVDEVFDFAKVHNLKIPYIAVDLETPIYQLNNILSAKGLRKVSELLKIRKAIRI